MKSLTKQKANCQMSLSRKCNPALIIFKNFLFLKYCRYERKVAAALYAELPYLTYEDALSHCLEAEKLVEYDWKENKLLIAKCYLAMKDYKNGVKWLVEADELTGKADVVSIRFNSKTLT